MNPNEIVDLKREAAELRTRIQDVEDEVIHLRTKLEERGETLAEHSVTLAYIKEHVTEVKSTVTQFGEAVSQLRIDTAVLTKKVAWIVGGISTAVTVIGANGPEWIQKVVDLLSK